MAELSPFIDLDTKIHELAILPEDFLHKPDEEGYAIDAPGEHNIQDGEQVYFAEMISNTEAFLNIKIVNLSYALDRIPELVPMAEQNLFSTYNKHGVVAPMLPEALVNALSFVEGQKRPAVTIQATVNINKGIWSNHRIYLSNGTNLRQITFPEIEPHLRKLQPDQQPQRMDEILWKIAWSSYRKRFGEEAAAKKLLALQNSESNQSPFASFMIGNLSNIAGEIMSYEAVTHAVPLLYWNKVHPSIDPATTWPMAENVNLRVEQLTGPYRSPLPYYPLIVPTARTLDWSTKGQPFGDVISWGNTDVQVENYAPCTAPIRKSLDLINIYNMVRYLQNMEPVFDEPRMLAVASKLGEEKRAINLRNQERNRQLQSMRKRQDHIQKISDELQQDYGNRNGWKDILLYIPYLNNIVRSNLQEALTDQISFLQTGPYMFENERYVFYFNMLHSIEQYHGYTHTITTEEEKQKFTLNDPTGKEIFHVYATGPKQKLANHRVIEVATLTLLHHQLFEEQTPLDLRIE